MLLFVLISLFREPVPFKIPGTSALSRKPTPRFHQVWLNHCNQECVFNRECCTREVNISSQGFFVFIQQTSMGLLLMTTAFPILSFPTCRKTHAPWCCYLLHFSSVKAWYVLVQRGIRFFDSEPICLVSWNAQVCKPKQNSIRAPRSCFSLKQERNSQRLFLVTLLPLSRTHQVISSPLYSSCLLSSPLLTLFCSHSIARGHNHTTRERVGKLIKHDTYWAHSI